jgi:hypothetical protein
VLERETRDFAIHVWYKRNKYHKRACVEGGFQAAGILSSNILTHYCHQYQDGGFLFSRLTSQ